MTTRHVGSGMDQDERGSSNKPRATPGSAKTQKEFHERRRTFELQGSSWTGTLAKCVIDRAGQEPSWAMQENEETTGTRSWGLFYLLR